MTEACALRTGQAFDTRKTRTIEIAFVQVVSGGFERSYGVPGVNAGFKPLLRIHSKREAG